MRGNYFDFASAYGFGMEADENLEEDVVETTTDVEDPAVDEAVDDVVDGGEENPNTQELQEEIPAVIDTTDVTNVVDDLGDTFEYGNDERPVTSNIDIVPEELQAEIDAIEEAADQHAQVGDDVGLMEEDPYHETPGGVDLTNDTDESMVGFDKIEEYAASVDETKVSGTSPNNDEYFREEYNEDRYDESTITGPSENEVEISANNVTINDYGNDPNDGTSELQSETTGDAKENTVSVDELDGDEDENEALPSAGDVLGTESDDGDYEADEEEVDTEDEAGEEVESDVEADDTDVEVEGESEESVEEVEVEEVSEDVEVEAGDEESCCAEEHAMVDALDVELNFDEGTVLTEEEQQEAEQAVEETEVEIPNEALNEVSEMADVNSPSGDITEPQTTEEEGDRIETATIDDETLMSDVIGEKAAETSHGDEDSEGFWEGDIPVNGDVDPENPEQQLSEGDAAYDEGAGSEGGEEVDSEEIEEAEDVVEEDVAEADTTEEVDTPEEADVELESADDDATAEDIEEDSDTEVEDIEEEKED